MTALDDVLAAHGAAVRPLYEVLGLLRSGSYELPDLVRLTAAPRRSVEDLLAAVVPVASRPQRSSVTTTPVGSPDRGCSNTGNCP
ncbi:hypothetical protein ABT261_17070, partial [Amycolatopsis sp. NPDC000740]